MNVLDARPPSLRRRSSARRADPPRPARVATARLLRRPRSSPASRASAAVHPSPWLSQPLRWAPAERVDATIALLRGPGERGSHHGQLASHHPAPCHTAWIRRRGSAARHLDGGHPHWIGRLSFRASDQPRRNGGGATGLCEPAPVEQDRGQLPAPDRLRRPAGARELPALGARQRSSVVASLLRQRPEPHAVHPEQGHAGIHALHQLRRGLPEIRQRSRICGRARHLCVRPGLRRQRQALHDPHGGSGQERFRDADQRRPPRARSQRRIRHDDAGQPAGGHGPPPGGPGRVDGHLRRRPGVHGDSARDPAGGIQQQHSPHGRPALQPPGPARGCR